MPRPLDAGVLAAVGQANPTVALLAHLDLPSGAVRLTTWRADLSWGGDTYLGDGRFAGFDRVEERDDLRATATVLAFLAPQGDPLFTALRDDAYQGRTARMWVAAFDGGGTLQVDDRPILEGFMSVPVWQFDRTHGPAIGLVVESPLTDDRPRELRWTDQDQKALFAGDKGLEFAGQLANHTIKPQGA